MFAHPGHKLLFMGNDFGQTEEWNFQNSLDWHLLEHDSHHGIQSLVKKLNWLYKNEPSLYASNFSPQGFEWIDHSDHENSVLSFLRKSENSDAEILIIINLTPVPRKSYRIGCPSPGQWSVLLNSDQTEFWGSNYSIAQTYDSIPKEFHGRPYSIEIDLPPLSCLYLKN
jgi:1,4-alpha-glucan branching enzyme